MSRSYKGIRAKKNRVYTVEDLTRLYGVSANTVSNWVKAGLRPSDDFKPYVFRGAVVSAFHQDRRARSKRNLRAGEFKCGGCKLAVFPDLNTIEVRVGKNGTRMLMAPCPECPSIAVKVSSSEDLNLLERHRNPNTTVRSPHEENKSAPGGIWTKSQKSVLVEGTVNDRILRKWQTYAGRFSESTIDQHLAAIRFCEDVAAGKPFGQFKIEDAGQVREALKQSLQARDASTKSKSTVAHCSSQLAAFFEWLRKQDGYKRLPQDISEYFKLPRSAYSKSLPRRKKEYLSMEEAEALLASMPSQSLLDKRARAMFALAFLGALRANTLVSLRICHIDIAKRQIIQDAALVRTKNGKSLDIYWFPLPDIFADVVKDWIALLRDKGFSENDALFPSNAWLTGSKNPKDLDREAVLPMSTSHAVSEAFALASRNSDKKFTPHSAKHTIAAECDKRPLTWEQRKFWSENMGHETEQITQTYYGKLTDEKRASLFEEITENKTFNLTALSVEQKAAFLDAIFEKVTRN